MTQPGNSTERPSASSQRTDGFRLWPALTAVGLLCAFGVLQSYSPFFVIPFVIGVGLAGLAAFVMAAMSAAGGHWRHAASMMVLPVAIAVTVGNSQVVLPPFAQMGDHLHVMLSRPAYEQKIATFSQPKGERYFDVIWNGFLGDLTILIYDETDRIADVLTEEDEQSRGLFASKCAGRARRITGHYYRCDLSL